jgi:phage-related protein
LYRVDFKNKNNIDLGLTTLSVGRRQRAQEQLIINPIPYADTEAIEHTGKYIPYDRQMEFYISDENQIDLINDWLIGYGKLMTDKDPGGYFKAHVMSGLEYEKYLQVKDKMTVTFKINPPFFYLNSGDTPLPFITSPAVINNPGTHHAEPLIKVTGSGHINLDINGKIVQLTGITDYIYIDSESQYVYKDTTNLGDKMVGDFPVLNPGVNNIAWTGTVTEIEIIGRWREK